MQKRKYIDDLSKLAAAGEPHDAGGEGLEIKWVGGGRRPLALFVRKLFAKIPRRSGGAANECGRRENDWWGSMNLQALQQQQHICG